MSKPQGSTCLYLFSIGIISMCHHTQDLDNDSRAQTRALMLLWRAFYQLSQLPSPDRSIHTPEPSLLTLPRLLSPTETIASPSPPCFFHHGPLCALLTLGMSPSLEMSGPCEATEVSRYPASLPTRPQHLARSC